MFGLKRKLDPLEVPAGVYDDIAARLHVGGYTFSFVDGMLVLDRIGLTRGPDEAPEEVNDPIARHRARLLAIPPKPAPPPLRDMPEGGR